MKLLYGDIVKLLIERIASEVNSFDFLLNQELSFKMMHAGYDEFYRLSKGESLAGLHEEAITERLMEFSYRELTRMLERVAQNNPDCFIFADEDKMPPNNFTDFCELMRDIIIGGLMFDYNNFDNHDLLTNAVLLASVLRPVFCTGIFDNLTSEEVANKIHILITDFDLYELAKLPEFFNIEKSYNSFVKKIVSLIKEIR